MVTPEKKKVYVDTCVISGLAKGDLPQGETSATFEILTMYKEEKIDLVTSVIAKIEIDKVPEKFRVPHESLYLLLSKIPKAHEYQFASTMALLGVSGGRRPFPLFAQLSNALPDEEDAKHVFTAIRNECSYFITVDKRTILNNRERVKVINPIGLLSPSEFITNYKSAPW